MKAKIETLYRYRHLFAGYMRTLIEAWYRLTRDKNFNIESIGHNSALFIERAVRGLEDE